MFSVYDANGCLLSKMATQQHRSKYDVSMKTLYCISCRYLKEFVSRRWCPNRTSISAVTILKSRSKITIFCQNRPKSKSLHLLSHVSILSCVDFLQQSMDVTGLKDYNFRRFQTEYCVYTKHGLKIEFRDFSFKIELKSIVWLKSHIVTALASIDL